MEAALEHFVRDLAGPLLFLLIAASLAVLARGADLLVDEAVTLSLRWQLPKAVVGATVVTDRAWKRIPAARRPRLRKSARNIGIRLQRKINKLGVDAIKVMKKHGLTVHAVPPDVVVAWEKRARQSYSKLIGHIVPKESVAEVERLRDAFRTSRGS